VEGGLVADMNKVTARLAKWHAKLVDRETPEVNCLNTCCFEGGVML